jgi:hypothetical protein
MGAASLFASSFRYNKKGMVIVYTQKQGLQKEGTLRNIVLAITHHEHPMELQEVLLMARGVP